MQPRHLIILKIVTGFLSLFTLIVWAIIAVVLGHQDEKYESPHDWLRAWWETINSSSWISLPEKVIRGGLKARNWIAKLLLRVTFSCFIEAFIAGFPLLVLIGCWIYFGYRVALLFLIGTLIVIVLAARATLLSFLPSAVTNSLLNRLTFIFAFWGILLTTIGSIVLWILILLEIRISIAAFLSMLAMPLHGLLSSMIILGLFQLLFGVVKNRLDREWNWSLGSDGYKEEKKKRIAPFQKLEEEAWLFSWGANVSVTITLLAILAGHIAEPSAPLPQKLQMLLSNIVFDALTLVSTFNLLSWAGIKDGLIKVPTAIFCSLVLAAFFACGSLYCGLVWTDQSLSIKQVIYVLFAIAPNGREVELSPYFWVMHTTFLPILIFLLVVLLFWLAKLFLWIVRWLFGKGLTYKAPVYMATVYAGLVLALLTALAFVPDLILNIIELMKG